MKDYELLIMMHRTGMTIGKALERYLKKNGLSVHQTILLITLKTIGVVSQDVLAKEMEVKPGTLSVRIARYEKIGIVTRKVDPNDGRKFNIYMTDKGYEIFRHACAVIKQFEKDILDGFSEEQVRNMITTFNMLKEKLERMESDV